MITTPELGTNWLLILGFFIGIGVVLGLGVGLLF